METIHCVIQEVLIYLLTACNNYKPVFKWNKLVSNYNCSLFISNLFLILQSMLSLSESSNDK